MPAPDRPGRTGGGISARSAQKTSSHGAAQAPQRHRRASPCLVPPASLSPGSRLWDAGLATAPWATWLHSGNEEEGGPQTSPPGSRLPRPELTPAPPAPARAAQGLSSQSGPSPPKTKRGRTGSQQKGVETAAPPPTREADEEKRLQLHDPPDPGWHLLPLTAERASSPRPEEKATVPSAGPGTRTGTVPGEHPPAHELGGTAAPLHPQSPRGRPHGLNTSTRVCTCPRMRACVCTHLYLCTHSLYTYIRTCVHLHTHMLTHMDTSTCTRTQTRRVCTMLQSVCAC